MSFRLLILSFATAHGLVLTPTCSPRASVVRMAGVINDSIDKDSPKVVTMFPVDKMEGPKAVICRCWKSGTFPLCDASHVKHNKETGDNVGPLIVEIQDSVLAQARELRTED